MDVQDAQLGALEEKHRLLLAAEEAELDYKIRSDDLKDRKFIESLVNTWKWALTTSAVVEALGMTPLQYVAQYGNERINAFVAAWNGSTAQAARDAGYTHPTTGYLLYRMPVIRAAIRERERNGVAQQIYNSEQLKAFWSGLVRNEDIEIKERIKASEALGKALGMFVQKTEVAIKDNYEDRLARLKERK